ncbi:MAG: hypothetical protein HY544_04620 [Candidatus Diapherotrites archaeon]|uniref:Protein export membrane protein SecD/SecF C-terminal domain-containing protein n=1 Tax=Candidatus Iainarchaeum sp. TaxID=3101447 RepID=A0A8T3YPT8_9ARCH|nr:hypothetical protein [Candidatus Diapherotrites archaeon]
MREVFRNWRVLLLGALVLLSLFAIFFNGLDFGIDFRGGTLFQVQLEDKAPADKLGTITSIVSERLDAFGLKDTKVSALGDDLIAAQIAETDPKRIEQLESLLKTQGRFEATLNGGILFQGSDILAVSRNPADGYGIAGGGGIDGTGSEWQLPFVLNQRAAENFSRKVFHKCTAVSFDVKAGAQYDCQKTYFFIDRPADAVIVLQDVLYASDLQAMSVGSTIHNIPQSTSIEELLQNAGLPHYILDSNAVFTAEQLQQLKERGEKGARALVPPSLPQAAKESLAQLGFKVVEVPQKDPSIPWVWTAVGARQVINVTPGIANLDPYVAEEKNARIFSKLVITGSSATRLDAERELKGTAVLLETGSLPVGIRSISKETISPLLGKEFLNVTLIIGLLALVVVSLVVFLRYRNIGLVVPIIVTCASEIIIILGVAAGLLFGTRFTLDLSSIAGILAAIGTGVDHQVIITDELSKGDQGVADTTSYSARIKKALFIIVAAAATAIVTMLPLLIFSTGFGKLRGFAIATVLGALIGVLITRPAFSVFAEYVFKKSAEKQQAK